MPRKGYGVSLSRCDVLYRVAFITMGCAKNEVDSADMRARLVGAGYTIVDDPEQADVIIVNTCSFIQAATEESIDAILTLAHSEGVVREDALLIVTGCMPSRYGDALADELVEASACIPCAQEDTIVSVVDELLGVTRSRASEGCACDATLDQALGEMSEEALDQVFLKSNRVSAYVKIADGCDRFCSFCTIPFIRGRYQSLSLGAIKRRVERLVTNGVQEIVFIAQDTGRWGSDFEEPSTLAHLLTVIAEEYPLTWLRVLYIQPQGITDELLNVFATHDNICKYLDIPFQHIEPTILARMNRCHSQESYWALIDRIRHHIPNCVIRTTLMAGFPGETDEHFDALCDFAATAELDYIGVFAYSREEGTRAFTLKDQLDMEEKQARAERLRDISDAACIPRVAQRIGQKVDVLVCGTDEDGRVFGRTQSQAPEVDGVTYLTALDTTTLSAGTIVKAVIKDTMLYDMEALYCDK